MITLPNGKSMLSFAFIHALVVLFLRACSWAVSHGLQRCPASIPLPRWLPLHGYERVHIEPRLEGRSSPHSFGMRVLTCHPACTA